MKTKILSLVSLLFVFSVVGCSSSPHFIKSEIVNNSDRTLQTPAWVLSGKVLNEENGSFVFSYKFEI
jgi:hypothetical protein